MRRSKLSFFWPLLFSFCALCAAENDIDGPCKRWYKSCPSLGIISKWVCTSVEDFQRFYSRGCPPSPTNATTPPPPSERCLLVDDVCQFSNSTLQCAFNQSFSDGCQYHCVEVNGSSWKNGSESCKYQRANGLPPPDTLCLPINGRCSSYNPCTYWPGFCLSPYKCGTWDDYYRFRFGPQPACARPPSNYERPRPPGDCLLINNSCSWSDCESYLGWCRFSWQCSTTYEAAIYWSGPPPPCPPPPANYTPPPPPGECLFNLTAQSCTFQKQPECESYLDWCKTYWLCSTAYEAAIYWSGPPPPCPLPPPGYTPPPPPGECRFNLTAQNCSFQKQVPDCVSYIGWCGSWMCTTPEERSIIHNLPPPPCPLPPVTTPPPGKCLFDVTTQHCSFQEQVPDCMQYLDQCQQFWLCGSVYEAAIYKALPPHPCPAPPPHYTVPPPPGECLFNLTQQRCSFGYYSTPTRETCADNELCDTPTFKCVEVGKVPFSTSTSVCLRQCSQDNGGCSAGQSCVERPVCKNCSTSHIMEGTCLNSKSVSCPSDVRLKCVEGTNECAMDRDTGGLSCVGSCFKNNGGCDDSSVCLSVPYSDCDPNSKTCSFINKCVSIKDLPEDSACPVGQEKSSSGRCSLGCEDYQSDTPTSSSSTCGGCVCPVGLVRYRDRCVDPKTCYDLVTDPPPFKPLPLTEHQVLVVMKVMAGRSNFVSGHKMFVSSVQKFLNKNRKPAINVTLHGYTGDVPLQVALLLSGEGVSKKNASSLAGLVEAGSGSYSFAIADVTVLDSPHIDDDDDDGSSTLIIAVPVIVFVLCAVTLLLVVIIILWGVVHKGRRPRVSKRKITNEVNVIKSGDSLSGQNGFKYSELYGTEDVMLEPLEEENCPDNKLADDK